MTEYALAPNRKFTATSPNTPAAMLEAGVLAAYRVRSNGTTRHLDLAPLGSTLRDTAEWANERVEMDGFSVARVAHELHVSTATVRRYLESLELTEEIEAGEWDDLTFNANGEPAWSQGTAEVDGEDQVEEILDQLAGMGKPTDQVLAELEATKAAQVTKDAALLARNRARFTKVAGAQCEPEGTPADEVEQALAASVAAKGAALPVCFCNGLGAHRPGGLPSCKNTPAIPRRTRTHG